MSIKQQKDIRNEKLSVPQVACVILIVIGIAGLKILGKE